MKEKIIQYLQKMQCEWFPVEWDSFASNFLGMEFSYPSIKNIKIKYVFYGENKIFSQGCYDVLVSEKNHNDQETITWNFWTLDRCKTILLNVIRSADEPKRKTLGYIIKGYEMLCNDSIIIVAYFDGAGSEIVWQDGEFK